MMDKTIQALKNSQNVLLELPTGSGKSLSLLCAAASWLESVDTDSSGQCIPEARKQDSVEASSSDSSDNPPARHHRIFIASRTHSQLAQLVRELRKSKYTPQMCILGSRNQYCIHREVMKAESKGEECQAKLRENACNFFHGAQKLAQHRQLMKGGNMEIHDIEGKKVS
jgi:Rad3-related DNA helicase